MSFEFGKNRKDPFKDNFYIGETKYYQNQWVRFHKLILDEYKNLNNVFLINFDKLINPEKSILAIASKIKCKCLGDLTHYIKNKPSKNIENKINDDQISQIYKLLLDKCIN